MHIGVALRSWFSSLRRFIRETLPWVYKIRILIAYVTIVETVVRRMCQAIARANVPVRENSKWSRNKIPRAATASIRKERRSIRQLHRAYRRYFASNWRSSSFHFILLFIYFVYSRSRMSRSYIDAMPLFLPFRFLSSFSLDILKFAWKFWLCPYARTSRTKF